MQDTGLLLMSEFLYLQIHFGWYQYIHTQKHSFINVKVPQVFPVLESTVFYSSFDLLFVLEIDIKKVNNICLNNRGLIFKFKHEVIKTQIHLPIKKEL